MVRILARLARTLGLTILLASSATAQPLMDSGQCHWLQANGVLGHTHIDLDATSRPQVSGVLVVGFTITLYHTDASVTQIFAGNYKSADAFDLVWDDTGATRPDLTGDPNGVRTWSGHFSVRPQIPHGWQWISMSVYTAFSDRTTVVLLNEPIYSIVNPSMPSPNDTDPAAQRTQAVCRVSPDLAHPELFYGEQTTQFDSALPRTVITAVIPMTGSTYGYGARGLGPALMDVRLDSNLHAGVEGTLLTSGVEFDHENGLIHAPTPFDPAVFGKGPHTILIRRTQQNGAELSAVILKTNVTVDPNAVPVPPPPPPAPAWVPIPATGTWEHLDSGPEAWRWCVQGVSGKFCVSVPAVQ